MRIIPSQKNLLHSQTFKILESLKAYINLFVVTVVVIYTNILFLSYKNNKRAISWNNIELQNMYWREQLTLLCITNVVELSTKSAQNLTSVLTFTAIAWDAFVPFEFVDSWLYKCWRLIGLINKRDWPSKMCCPKNRFFYQTLRLF